MTIVLVADVTMTTIVVVGTATRGAMPKLRAVDGRPGVGSATTTIGALRAREMTGKIAARRVRTMIGATRVLDPTTTTGAAHARVQMTMIAAPSALGATMMTMIAAPPALGATMMTMTAVPPALVATMTMIGAPHALVATTTTMIGGAGVEPAVGSAILKDTPKPLAAAGTTRIMGVADGLVIPKGILKPRVGDVMIGGRAGMTMTTAVEVGDANTVQGLSLQLGPLFCWRPPRPLTSYRGTVC